MSHDVLAFLFVEFPFHRLVDVIHGDGLIFNAPSWLWTLDWDLMPSMQRDVVVDVLQSIKSCSDL